MYKQCRVVWTDKTCSNLTAAVNAESSGLVTGALGGGFAFAVMLYATAGMLYFFLFTHSFPDRVQ